MNVRCPFGEHPSTRLVMFARLVSGLLLGLSLLAPAGTAAAQRNDSEGSHTVTARASAYKALRVAPAPSFVAGPGASKVVESTYSIVTNVPTAQKIVVSLRGAVPKGVAIWVDLEPPEGATAPSRGPVKLLGVDGESRSRTLVTGIGQVSASGLTVTYTTKATIVANPGDKRVQLAFELVE